MLEVLTLTVCMNAAMNEGCLTTAESEPVNHNQCEWKSITLQNKMATGEGFYLVTCEPTDYVPKVSEKKRRKAWALK